MKLEFQSHLLRLVIELFPALPLIRRYRVVPVPGEAARGRFLRRRILHQLRDSEEKAT